MALTRKFLTALGIEADKVDEIISAHVETVEPLKAERDKYKAEAEEYKADAEKLPNVQKELDDLKKTEGKDAYKVKYEAIKEEYDNFKNDIESKETKAKKEAAYRKVLKRVGVSEKRIDSVIKVSDIDSIELDDDGKIKGLDELKKNIKEEWADFITSTSTEGAHTANPPSNEGGTVRTRQDIIKIKDTTERQNAWKEFLAQESQKGN